MNLELGSSKEGPTKGSRENRRIVSPEVARVLGECTDVSSEGKLRNKGDKVTPILRETRLPISRTGLKQCARDLLNAAEELEKSLDGTPVAPTKRIRVLLLRFKDLENVITGSTGSDKPVHGTLSRTNPVKARQMARAAKEVAESLLSKNFTNSTLREAAGEAGPAPAKDKPLPGEWMVSVAVDGIAYSTLDYSNTEAVTRQAASEWARNSEPGTKLAVSTAQYLLGVSPLKLGNDVTKMLGEAVQGSNAKSLKANMAVLSKAGRVSPKLEKRRRVAVLPPSPPPLIDWTPTPNPVRPETTLSLSELPDPEEPFDRGLRGPGI